VRVHCACLCVLVVCILGHTDVLNHIACDEMDSKCKTADSSSCYAMLLATREVNFSENFCAMTLVIFTYKVNRSLLPMKRLLFVLGLLTLPSL